MKKNIATMLITLGKNERAKYEPIRTTVTDVMNELYDITETLHDGKWLWIPIDYEWSDMQELLHIKRKPNKKK